MANAEGAAPWNSQPQQPVRQPTLDQRAGAQSECQRAIAEAETVLRELVLVEPRTRRSNLEFSGAETEKSRAPSDRSALARAVPRGVDRLRLDPDLDFFVRGGGLIEMTEAGVRRMVQAHSAGLDVVIGINGREVLRFLAPQRALHEPAVAGRPAAEPSLRVADRAAAVARNTPPVAELLRAEDSTEVALQMISRERQREEIEALLPWHATGTLSRCDAERVERALAEDSVLARRFQLVLEELAAAAHLNDALGSPSERAMEKLFAAIDAEEARHARARPQSLSETPATVSSSR